MAHPSSLRPKNAYFVDGAVTATPGSEYRYFHSVACLKNADASDVTLKGSGMYRFFSTSDNATGYINPATGKDWGGTPTANGWYEALAATGVNVVIPVGTTIHGRFTSVNGDAGDLYIAYE